MSSYSNSSSPSPYSSASSPSSNSSNESSVPKWRQVNREPKNGSNSQSNNRQRVPASSSGTSSTSSTGQRNWRSVNRNANSNDPHNLNTPGLLMTIDPGPKPPQDDPSSSQYQYGPTRLPPVPYQGQSPFNTTHSSGRKAQVPNSAVDFLPKLAERVESVERAVEGYMHVRANEALERSSIESLQRQSSHRPRPSGHGTSNVSGSGSYPVYPSNHYPSSQYNYQYR